MFVITDHHKVSIYVHLYLLRLDSIFIELIPNGSSSMDKWLYSEDSKGQILGGKIAHTIKTNSCAGLFDDCTVGKVCASLIVDLVQR